MPRVPDPIEIQNEAERLLTQQLTQAFLEVMAEHAEDGFTADDVHHKCAHFPKGFLAKKIPAMFRIFQSTGYLKKLSTYRLSTRNSYPLPVWIQERNVLPAYGDKRRKRNATKAT